MTGSIELQKRTRVSDSRDWYLSCFSGFEQRLNGGADTPIHGLRKEAIARFADAGLPTGKDESWRHSNPQRLTRTEFTPCVETGAVAAADVAPFLLADTAAQLVFVDGVYAPELSGADPPAGVRVVSLGEAFADGVGFAGEHLGRHAAHDAGFAALNTAFVADGAAVHIARGARVDAPIHLLFLSTGHGDGPVMSLPRTLVVAETGSRATVVETFAGAGSQQYLTNAVSEIVLAGDCELEHCCIQREGQAASHVGLLHVSEGGGSRFTSTSVALAGQLIRREVVTALEGEGVHSTLNGLYLGAATEQIDNYTTIEHAAPNCSSHELYKGVLGGNATGVFRGKIHVHRVAQNTDAYQSNQNLLLSTDAEVTSQPQLEIYADDVRCSHGSTTGELDEEALFYLQSRGIPRAAAVRVLTRAFAGEIVDRIGPEELREQVRRLADGKFEHLAADPRAGARNIGTR